MVWTKPVRPRDVPAPGVLVNGGGHRLHVVSRGSGEPVVLLESGIAASSLSWALVQPQIATFTTAVSYDRAGLAWSDAASCPRSLAQIHADLRAVLAHTAGDRRVVLVGHSFGSLVVRSYAARHREQVLGLVLIDPPTEWLNPDAEQLQRLRRARHLAAIGAGLARIGVVHLALSRLMEGKPRAPRRLAKMFGARAAQAIERLVGEVQKLPPELHPALQSHWSNPKCFHAMADYLRILQDEAAAIASQIPAADLPTVVISGGHQSEAEIARHRKMADASAAGRHVIAKRSGHWVPFDEPDVVVEAVRRLIDAAR